jgi:hypothetical protein
LSIARAAEAWPRARRSSPGRQAGDDAAGDQLVVFANQYVHGGSLKEKASRTERIKPQLWQGDNQHGSDSLVRQVRTQNCQQTLRKNKAQST